MDQPILFSMFAFLTLMAGLSWVGYRVIYKPGRFLKQLGNPVITDPARQRTINEDREARAQHPGDRAPAHRLEGALLGGRGRQPAGPT